MAASCAKPAATDQSLYKRLEDDNPSVRLAAIVQAGQARDKAAAGQLVKGLGDSDGDVRFLSFVALKRITGQTMGYRYYDPPEVRAQAIQRWRQWLKEHKTFAAPATQAAAVAAGGARS